MKKITLYLITTLLLCGCIITDDITPEELDKPNSGLVLRITFDNKNAEDISGYNQDGVINSSNFVTNTPNGEGYAYNIVNEDDLIRVPYNPLKEISEYSICFWVRDPSQGLLLNAYGNSTNSSSANFPTIRISNNNFYAGFSWGSISDHFTYDSTTILQNGDWHHVVITVTPDYQHLYINGSRMSTQQTNVDYSESSEIHIGGALGNIAGALMKIDNIRLYNRAIPDSQIKLIINEER